MRNSLILVFLLLFVLASPCWATQVTLQQGQDSYTGASDTWMFEDSPTTVYSTDETMFIKNELNSYTGRVLLKFDVSSLAGATINSAIVYIYKTEDHDNDYTVAVYRVLKPWVDSEATWNRWHNTNSKEWGTAGADNANDAGTDNSGDGTDYDTLATPTDTYADTAYTGAHWLDFDITTLVAGWVAGSINNNGVMFRTTGATTLADAEGTIASSEYTTNTAYRPKLTIDYTAGGGSRRIITIQ